MNPDHEVKSINLRSFVYHQLLHRDEERNPGMIQPRVGQSRQRRGHDPRVGQHTGYPPFICHQLVSPDEKLVDGTVNVFMPGVVIGEHRFTRNKWNLTIQHKILGKQ
jgi:hypothetical protein